MLFSSVLQKYFNYLCRTVRSWHRFGSNFDCCSQKEIEKPHSFVNKSLSTNNVRFRHHFVFDSSSKKRLSIFIVKKFAQTRSFSTNQPMTSFLDLIFDLQLSLDFLFHNSRTLQTTQTFQPFLLLQEIFVSCILPG